MPNSTVTIAVVPAGILRFIHWNECVEYQSACAVEATRTIALGATAVPGPLMMTFTAAALSASRSRNCETTLTLSVQPAAPALAGQGTAVDVKAFVGIVAPKLMAVSSVFWMLYTGTPANTVSAAWGALESTRAEPMIRRPRSGLRCNSDLLSVYAMLGLPEWDESGGPADCRALSESNQVTFTSC
jgi:hypothetical protein